MEQNTIAMIWDFDKTLINGYMHEPIFRHYGVDYDAFWGEVADLQAQYARQGIRVNRDTVYLNHFITCANQGVFPGLNNEVLHSLGAQMDFYPGAVDFFADIKATIAAEARYKAYGIHVEHYIISAGLSKIIAGSAINDQVDGVWGCEFIETPVPTALGPKPADPAPRHIQQVGYIVDNTSKTRAVFEINKGSNRHAFIDVNSRMARADRRVPFEQMIYIADGPSDVPVFSILKQYGGKTFAVFPRGSGRAFAQVEQLRSDGRVDYYAEADYSPGTTAHMWLKAQTRMVADGIAQRAEDEIRRNTSAPPRHISEH